MYFILSLKKIIFTWRNSWEEATIFVYGRIYCQRDGFYFQFLLVTKSWLVILLSLLFYRKTAQLQHVHSAHLQFCEIHNICLFSIFCPISLVPQEFMLPIAGTKLVIFFFSFLRENSFRKIRWKQNANYQVVF